MNMQNKNTVNVNINVGDLTAEKYEKIREELQNEKIDHFPSLFQQARNLAKQAWLSGIDAAKGKPILASAEKAAARLQICQTCDMYKDKRCIQCGCFMEAKSHVESSNCPLNRWGPELQSRMTPQNIVDEKVSKGNSEYPRIQVSTSSLTAEEQAVLDKLMTRALKQNAGRFTYNGVVYDVILNADGNKTLMRLDFSQPPIIDRFQNTSE